MAAERGEADALADAVIAAAEAAGTFGGTKFGRSFVTSARTYSEAGNGARNTVYVTSLDLTVWHQSAA